VANPVAARYAWQSNPKAVKVKDVKAEVKKGQPIIFDNTHVEG
jgi:hypothetical protein